MTTSATDSATAPLVATVDVLIVGGSAGAVACALAARASGCSVLLAAPRSYLGDDLCAPLRLWQDATGQGELAQALFPTGTVPTPLAIKRTLEDRALAAGVEILLEAMPAGVLRDASGRVAGALLATRAGRIAVAAGRTVDAGRSAPLARAAGATVSAEAGGTLPVSRVILGRELTAGEAIAGEVAFRNDADAVSLAARRLSAQIPWQGPGTAQLHAADAAARLALWDGQALAIADDADWRIPMQVGAVAGLHQLSGAEPLPLIAMGERLGASLAGEPASGRPVDGGIAEARPWSGLRLAGAGLRPGATAPRLAVDPGLPVLAEVEVLVVGGGTGGAPAGIAAARQGARTLVIERLHALGGVGTLGQITSYYHGNRVGFTAEVDAAVHTVGGTARPRTSPGSTWDSGWKSRWWSQELVRCGGKVWFGVTVMGVVLEGDRVVGVAVAGEHGAGVIRCRAVVDATGAAEIPHLAGAPTVVVGAEHVAVQGTGLAQVKPGWHYNNSDHTFCDDSDPVDATRMFIATRHRHEGAFDLGQLIDSRERRRIVGEFEVGPLDILADRTVPDAVVRAMSNFDSHGFTVHPLFLVKPPNKKGLASWVPYRALLPRGLEGVLVTGLGMSAHRDALPVLRMQPDVQNAGFAAGVAAAMAAAAGCGVRAIDIAALQRVLVQQGNLPAEVIGMPDSFPVADREVAWAVGEGLDEHRGIAICFAEPARCRAGLLAALADPARRERAAQILGLQGVSEAAPVLRTILEAAAWDAGWSFRGMGQFDFSMSRIDSLLVALARCGRAGDHAPALRLAGELSADAALSHLRACAWALAEHAARHPADAPAGATALARLLRLPGIGGHACTSLAAAVALARANPAHNDNATRDRSLKELHLAVGLWRCGDVDGLAARTLADYRSDVRGHYARHAAAVLAERAASAASASGR